MSDPSQSEQEQEPGRYYDSQKRQWFSVKKQKWVTPEEEIRLV